MPTIRLAMTMSTTRARASEKGDMKSPAACPIKIGTAEGKNSAAGDGNRRSGDADPIAGLKWQGGFGDQSEILLLDNFGDGIWGGVNCNLKLLLPEPRLVILNFLLKRR